MTSSDVHLTVQANKPVRSGVIIEKYRIMTNGGAEKAVKKEGGSATDRSLHTVGWGKLTSLRPISASARQ